MKHPLFKILEGLKDEPEFLELLEITLTEKEREMVLERWRIFEAIDQGLSQREVAKEVGCSVATATRGAKAYREYKPQIQKWLEAIRSNKS